MVLHQPSINKSLCLYHSYAALITICIALGSLNLFAQTRQWVGTWSCAPYAAGTNTPPSPYLANNTFRQIVRVSIGGDTLRIKFSNKTSTTAVTMNSVNIAVSPDATKSAITLSTITQLKFSGKVSVTMSAGGSAVSDPVAFPLTPSMRLAITIYYGQCQTSADMTHHYGSRTNSYILAGDQTASATFAGSTPIERWYHINTIDVLADTSKTHAVVALGNSITDGYGLTGGLENRWTDSFSQALLNNAATAQVGVLNLGIGGTNVAGNGATTGATRFQQDVLDQSGVRWLIIFYGINDIGASNTSTATIIAAYQKMITDAHAKNIKVYGATITPVRGNTYYTDAHEGVRAAVNKWIRTTGNFDAYFDFDKTIRNPSDTASLQAIYSNDWLHPNAAGYKLLGESIDLKYFSNPVAVNGLKVKDNQGYVLGQICSSRSNGNVLIPFEIPHESYVSLKVCSVLGKEIKQLGEKKFSSGKHMWEIKASLAKGTYLCLMKTGEFSVSRKMVIPAY